MEPTTAEEQSGKRATINDIARIVGVSKVTVSYVLNAREGRVKITERTRQRVFEVAKELNYSSNALARSLANRKTNTLTLVTQDPRILSADSAFVTQLVRSVAKAAFEAEYDLILHTKPAADINAEVSAIMDGRVDGALLLRDRDDPVGQTLTERGFPNVNIFSHGTSPNEISVDIDNVRGEAMAVEYLIGLGHKRIAHISGSLSSAAILERVQGYRLAMDAANLPIHENWVVNIPNPQADYAGLNDLLNSPDAPTALVVWSDDVAMAAMVYLRSQFGLSVPEDLSVVGFDSTSICNLCMPRLTSMRQPIEEMAATAVKTLVDAIEKRPILENRIVFKPELVERESCAAPK